jgi:hypothetical protein
LHGLAALVQILTIIDEEVVMATILDAIVTVVVVQELLIDTETNPGAVAMIIVVVVTVVASSENLPVEMYHHLLVDIEKNLITTVAMIDAGVATVAAPHLLVVTETTIATMVIEDTTEEVVAVATLHLLVVTGTNSTDTEVRYSGGMIDVSTARYSLLCYYFR